MPVAADLYYHVYAEDTSTSRSPIVLIHGAGGNHLYWPPEVRRLPGFTVYALDLPGHGESSGSGQQSIEAYTQSILAWMDAIELTPAVLVGHSMGGAIALTLALDAHDRVSALALIGSGARLRVHSDLLENSANETTFHTAIETVAQWSFSTQAPSRLVELATQRMSEVRPSVLNGDFIACDHFDETERIAGIKQPTLLIVGAEDRMTPPRFSIFLSETIPDARLETVPEAGHMVMLEKPQAVADHLLKFLHQIENKTG
jgi:pimeloyl-ACP methyl ester carboxylesterase